MEEKAQQIVIFEIDGQSYGTNIKEVNEIIKMQEITSLPKTSEVIAGITKLRGNICTILHLGKKLGIRTTAEEDLSECKIIVVKDSKIGLIVDNVTEIASITTANIKSLESLDSLSNNGLVECLVELESKIITVLNMDEVTKPVS